jgi:hypothetical protein
MYLVGVIARTSAGASRRIGRTRRTDDRPRRPGRRTQIAQRSDAWYAHGNEIADFLSAANPHNWPQRKLRRLLSAGIIKQFPRRFR